MALALLLTGWGSISGTGFFFTAALGRIFLHDSVHDFLPLGVLHGSAAVVGDGVGMLFIELDTPTA